MDLDSEFHGYILVVISVLASYIRLMSTRARSYSLWLSCFWGRSSSVTVRVCTAIWAYVPAARRFESVPGLITRTLLTT